jgi:hypothetical protein
MTERNQRHQKDFDARQAQREADVASGKIKLPPPQPEVQWPVIGEIYADRVVDNRRLTITAVDEKNDRVCGVVRDGLIANHGGDDYGADMRVFTQIWRKL